MELTHASFFSGVGGLDLGLERAGWRTVSFSEIDPYASAVLAERWPGVPNLGSILGVVGEPAGRAPADGLLAAADGGRREAGAGLRGDPDWTRATLWSGGFPCQDLSVAGKRRGMGSHDDRADTRSGLAYAFLDLVERYRPPAVLLENVPGLLSSNAGRDFYALQRRLAELGYVGAYRILDARHFGVPQRRRRVFIVALDARRGATADDAAEVLSVGSRCRRHPASGGEAGEGAAAGAGGSTHGVVADGATESRTIQAGMGHHGYTLGAQDVDGGWLQLDGISPTVPTGLGRGMGHNRDEFLVPDYTTSVHTSIGRRSGPSGDEVRNLVGVRPSPDPGGVRAADGLAGRLDGSRGVAHSLRAQPNASHREDTETYAVGGGVSDDPLLPLGLDSHRYRCCGNGVVASVAEWVGLRLANFMLDNVHATAQYE